MIRKLLKRKSITVSTKKLKTIKLNTRGPWKTWKTRKTSLSQWAERQLALRKRPWLSMFFPKAGNFYPLEQGTGYGKGGRGLDGTSARQIIERCVISSLILQAPTEWGREKPFLKADYAADVLATTGGDKPPISLATTGLEPFPLAVSPKSEGEESLGTWSKGWLRLVSRKKHVFPKPPVSPKKVQSVFPLENRIHSHWKGLYSLDRLFSHQFDSTLRLRQSAHKRKCLEMQKLTSLYGKLSKKHFRHLFFGSKNSTSPRHIHTIAALLEGRLDNAVRRCFAFTSVSAAHHWIGRGKILVNGRKVTCAHFPLKGGDCIALAPESKTTYKQQVLALLGARPREKKFTCGVRLRRRWKEFASLYGSLKHHYPLAADSGIPPQNLPAGGNFLMGMSSPQLSPSPRAVGYSKTASTVLPNWHMERYFYSRGRLVGKRVEKISAYSRNATFFPSYQWTGQRLSQWLARHPWPPKKRGQRGRLFFRNNWRVAYRSRLILFSQWLLQEKILLSDGLYNCRWLKAFVRKKGVAEKKACKAISLQKPLHFEISYKKQCAIFLFPPQKLLWPVMIDLKRLHS